MTATSPLGIGIIGFGRIGAEHAAWLASARGAVAVAVADATAARQALARERGLVVYPDVAGLLADVRVEAVLVATPTAMHREHVGLALSADKHVMVEKPMSLDLGQSRELADEADRRGRVLSVFQNRRWDVDYLTVRKAVASGIFGKVINAESRLGQFSSCVGPAAKEYRPNWRNEASFGGGGLYDWGSHFIDQMWRLFYPAKPTRVFAQLRGNVWSRDCDDFARVLIDFDNGAVGLVEINTTTNHSLPRWHIDGTRGSASAPASPTFNTNQWADLHFTAAPGALADSATQGEREIEKAEPGLSETAIWEQFAAAVRGDGVAAVTVQSVLPTMALLDAVRASSQTGMAVHVSETVDWVY